MKLSSSNIFCRALHACFSIAAISSLCATLPTRVQADDLTLTAGVASDGSINIWNKISSDTVTINGDGDMLCSLGVLPFPVSATNLVVAGKVTFAGSNSVQVYKQLSVEAGCTAKFVNGVMMKNATLYVKGTDAQGAAAIFYQNELTMKSLDGNGQLVVGAPNATGNLTITGNALGSNLIMAKNVSLNGTANTASSIVSGAALTIAAANAVGKQSITTSLGYLSAPTLNIGSNAKLDVTNILTSSNINITSSGGSVDRNTALISAASITGDANSTLSMTLTAEVLGEILGGEGSSFTLIEMDTAYLGNIDFTIGTETFTLEQSDAEIIILAGNTHYSLSKANSANAGQPIHQIFIKEGKTVPEPSTATLSLLALAALLARRRRKQA